MTLWTANKRMERILNPRRVHHPLTRKLKVQ